MGGQTTVSLMSTLEEIRSAVEAVGATGKDGQTHLLIAHSTHPGRAIWGTDQAASVELVGFERLIRNIRDIEKSLGDGVKRLYESEGPRKKLRRVR